MAIDRAIAAAEAPAPEQRATIQVKLGSGRVVVLNAPVDLRPTEAIDLIGYVATGLAGELAKARPAPRIIPVRGRIPRA